jgi:hypothetical protein
MFRCFFTKKLSKPGEHPYRLVTHIRNKTYYRLNSKTGAKEVVGYGTETVREVMVSAEHYAKLMADGFIPVLVKDEMDIFKSSAQLSDATDVPRQPRRIRVSRSQPTEDAKD